MTALTHHGGRLDVAERLYPDAARPWIDLSTGINPVPWVPPVDLVVDWARLPSPDALLRLEAVAAAFFAADPDTVVAVPGTEIALRMLGRLGLPGPYHRAVPAYRTHEAVFPDATPVSLDDPVPAGGTLLLANPNNPDGRVLDAVSLARLGAGRWLVVDAAFADCAPSVPPADPGRTITLRSFGKFFGLAGVRLGFVVAPPAIVAALRAMLGDWPVSAGAIAFGTAAYADAGWIAATRARLAADAVALDAVLRRHGLEPEGACPLFRLVAAPADMFERLARAGLLTRPFEALPGRLRLGLPADAAALDRLDRALG